MSKTTLLYFGEIDRSQVKDEYISALTYEGKKIKIDLNFFDEEGASDEVLEKVQKFLGAVEEHIRNAYKYLADDYEAEGETYGYIEHHMDELEENVLAEIIPGYQADLHQDDELFEKLHLQRIGIFPEDDDEFAVFDFSIGTKHTDYLIAIFINQDGEVVDLGIES